MTLADDRLFRVAEFPLLSTIPTWMGGLDGLAWTVHWSVCRQRQRQGCDPTPTSARVHVLCLVDEARHFHGISAAGLRSSRVGGPMRGRGNSGRWRDRSRYLGFLVCASWVVVLPR